MGDWLHRWLVSVDILGNFVVAAIDEYIGITLNSGKFKKKSKFFYTLLKEGFSVFLSPKPISSLFHFDL